MEEKTGGVISELTPTFKVSRKTLDAVTDEIVQTIMTGPFDVTDRACMKWASGMTSTLLSHSPIDPNGVQTTVRDTAMDAMRRSGAKLAEVDYGSEDEEKAWSDAWSAGKSLPMASVMLDYLDNMG